MTNESMQQAQQGAFLSGGSEAYLESLYDLYLQNSADLPQAWRDYFDALKAAEHNPQTDISHAQVRQEFRQLARQPRSNQVTSNGVDHVIKQTRVTQLINAYRTHGHHKADLDPIGLQQPETVPNLTLGFHNLSDADRGQNFSLEGALLSTPQASLQTIIDALEKTYCGSIGVEYAHVMAIEESQWLQQRMESVQAQPQLSVEQKQRLHRLLAQAEGLEKYLATKYVGQKRFSLEGGESLIPIIDEIIQRGGGQGAKEVVIGMAHRGRLNVLINIFGKSSADLFEEFEGRVSDEERAGDVKYHMGFSSDVQTSGGPMHLALAFNPSHLEIIAPVVQGSVRARQVRRQDDDRKQVIPVIVHGDSAVAGQGVVMETLNFSQARGFCTGGTIHIVVNNQVGFTTSNPHDTRSTLYCTDVAKMVQAPIFHVNGDDVEAVCAVAQMALDYRMKFKKDIVIDLMCYRRHGHNEADEPSMTQPVMYQHIKKLPTTYKKYTEKLIKQGIYDQQQARIVSDTVRDKLDKGEPMVTQAEHSDEFATNWSPYLNKKWREDYTSSLSIETLKKLGAAITTLPEGLVLQPQVRREYETRTKMMTEELPLNWGAAENLAYATLLAEGYLIRFCGQDAGRGTFSHRHAVVHDYKNGQCYKPLQHLGVDQAQFVIIDSILSEEAVMGFEYGYACAEPDSLVIWEAQFGDFANGAQVVIDQFISSGEQKWGRLCGLTLFLPHGYEGMGAEHSSARLERFLQLCAQKNMQVCVPTTPAQHYHLLRRQLHRAYRKPLVVMTPKSLLRNRQAVSPLSHLAEGHFQLLIDDELAKPKSVKRIILCCGKVYYELLTERDKLKIKDTAIIRFEQLYPFPTSELQALFARYSQAETVVWCQEEPKNQGAWYFMHPRISKFLPQSMQLVYRGRPRSAAPAVGSSVVHKQEQQTLLTSAFSQEDE